MKVCSGWGDHAGILLHVCAMRACTGTSWLTANREIWESGAIFTFYAKLQQVRTWAECWLWAQLGVIKMLRLMSAGACQASLFQGWPQRCQGPVPTVPLGSRRTFLSPTQPLCCLCSLVPTYTLRDTSERPAASIPGAWRAEAIGSANRPHFVLASALVSAAVKWDEQIPPQTDVKWVRGISHTLNVGIVSQDSIPQVLLSYRPWCYKFLALFSPSRLMTLRKDL